METNAVCYKLNVFPKSGGGSQRRSKSEESLLERVELRQVKEATRSRRSSPLSHSSSVNQHLSRQAGERFIQASDRCGGQMTGSGQRRSHSRERSEDLSGAGGSKSRIPLPVRILSDKDDLSSSGGDSHFMASPEPTTGHVSSHVSGRDHVHSGYVSSRYSDRYQPSSSYMNSYNPSHLYTDYTVTQSSVYGGYRPTSAKDYNRYNYYSTVNTEPDSYLSGTGTGSSSSPRWRRRSYDHDSDYLRYQRRTSGRSTSSTLADYPPAPSSGAASSSSSSALTR